MALSLTALFGFLIWRQRKAPGTVKPAEVNEAPARVISAIQQEILAFFWARDAGKRFSVKTMEMHIGLTSNEVQHGLDELIEHNYLSDSLDALTGRSYFLNEKGRKLCAELFTTAPPTAKA